VAVIGKLVQNQEIEIYVQKEKEYTQQDNKHKENIRRNLSQVIKK